MNPNFYGQNHLFLWPQGSFGRRRGRDTLQWGSSGHTVGFHRKASRVCPAMPEDGETKKAKTEAEALLGLSVVKASGDLVGNFRLSNDALVEELRIEIHKAGGPPALFQQLLCGHAELKDRRTTSWQNSSRMPLPGRPTTGRPLPRRRHTAAAAVSAAERGGRRHQGGAARPVTRPVFEMVFRSKTPKPAVRPDVIPPDLEPLVLLEKFNKPYQMRRWTFFPFDHATKDPVLQGIPTQADSNLVDLEKDQVSDSSDSSSSSTSSDASASAVDDADVGPVDELIVARFTKVQHIMIETDDSLCPFWESRYFKAACGARLPRDDCVFDVQLRPQFSMCRHVACFKRWQQITALAD
eukprot:s420_g5.t1